MRLQARPGWGLEQWLEGGWLELGLFGTSTNHSILSFYFIVRAKPVGSDIVCYIKSIIFLSINNCLKKFSIKNSLTFSKI